VRENRTQGSARGLPGNVQFYLNGLRIIPAIMKPILLFTTLLLLVSCSHNAESHRSRMMQAFMARIVPEGTQNGIGVASLDAKQQAKYEHHRKWLIENGVLFEKKYSFKSLKSGSEESKALWLELMSNPPRPIVDGSAPYRKGESLELTLWGEYEDLEFWDNFMNSKEIEAQQNGGGNSAKLRSSP